MRSWVRKAAVATAVAVVGLLAPRASADLVPPLGIPLGPLSTGSTPIGTLGDVLHFHGGIDNPIGIPLVSSPVPVVCILTCQEFTFVSPGTMPFLVSVKDTAGSTNNGWDVSVYQPNGGMVAVGNGIGANGQAVAVPHPVVGTYHVFVTFTYAYDAAAKYEGEVRPMVAPHWTPASPTCDITVSGVRGCYDLPVLQAAPAADFHVDGIPPAASTPLGFPLPFALPTATSCYLDETLQTGAMRCLRFTSDVRNVGPGLLDIRVPWLNAKATPPTSGFVDGQCNADQAVHMTDNGGVVTRPAGACMFHPIHAHFHYKDLVGFSLHTLSATHVIGPQVGLGLKESFCLADDNYVGYGTTAPNGPRTYVGQPGCNLPASLAGGSVVVAMGITPGWGDVYTWDTPGQYIDITTTPPGSYALVEKTNPGGTLLVGGAPQTCSATEITLTATAVTATKVLTSVPCPA